MSVFPSRTFDHYFLNYQILEILEVFAQTYFHFQKQKVLANVFVNWLFLSKFIIILTCGLFLFSKLFHRVKIRNGLEAI